jgi:hypothetical protein
MTGAFLRELEREMRGAQEDAWYAWLRVFWWRESPEALRAEARRLVDAGERPPSFEYGSDYD